MIIKGTVKEVVYDSDSSDSYTLSIGDDEVNVTIGEEAMSRLVDELDCQDWKRSPGCEVYVFDGEVTPVPGVAERIKNRLEAMG